MIPGSCIYYFAGRCCHWRSGAAAGRWVADRSQPQQAAAVQLHLPLLWVSLLAAAARRLAAGSPPPRHSPWPRPVPAAPKAACRRPLGRAAPCWERVTPCDLPSGEFAASIVPFFVLLHSLRPCSLSPGKIGRALTLFAFALLPTAVFCMYFVRHCDEGRFM